VGVVFGPQYNVVQLTNTVDIADILYNGTEDNHHCRTDPNLKSVKEFQVGVQKFHLISGLIEFMRELNTYG